jgi:NADPH:quinone reductase-like Zn-dependent oxidoreductase
VEWLKEQGATIVLNSSEADFEQQLHDACHQAEAHLAFDAVAGPMTRQLLDALPERSKVIVYSCLSYEGPQAGADHFIFEGKAIDGFWLGPWINDMNLIQILMMWRRAQKLMSTDLRSEVRVRYPFEEAEQAVKDYLSQMTGGKVLLTPSQ